MLRFVPDYPPPNAAPTHLTNDRHYIETTFGLLCNMPLLCDHSASWEILVSKKCVSNMSDEINNESPSAVHIPVG